MSALNFFLFIFLFSNSGISLFAHYAASNPFSAEPENNFTNEFGINNKIIVSKNIKKIENKFII
jgi:hypothetical protein